MDETDRLAEIKAHRHLMYGPNTDPHHFVDIRLSDLDWLVGEVERLRVGAAGQKRLIEDGDRWMERANRLRGLLARLEWVARGTADYNACPACDRLGNPHDPGEHDPDCWLAKELGR